MAAGAGGPDRVARLNALDALITMPRADELDEVRAAVDCFAVQACCAARRLNLSNLRQLLDDDPRFEDAEEEEGEEKEENGEAANGSHPGAAH